KGTVNVNCDITNEPFDQKITSFLELVVKFGDEYNDENDEILIVPHGEHQINIAQYVYEMLVLAIPQKRVHPGVEDGTLESEVIDKLEELQPKEVKENKGNNTDPRWDALKKLLKDK
ncbi:MAG: YceD family protein, partial [Flavobacteriales bacterium]